MNVHVTVDLDGDTLVAVKTATGTDAVDRLRHEAVRLADASHPGVVAVVACRDVDPAVPAGGGPGEPSCELRTVYAGEPVTRWTGSVADVGGVAAAVASTLADLHAAGIVHGRLDPSHVLLGDGGRPRLCGWSGPDGAGAADDVAAWGRLVHDLITRAPAPRRGLRSAARGGGSGARRALSALVDRATDPVPTRRPSARALADLVMTAGPAATQPDGRRRPGGGRGTARRPAAATTPPHGDTLDRIWSYAGEPSEDERWAAAFGTAPADSDITTSGPPDLPLAAVDALEWSASAPVDGGPTPLAGADEPYPHDPDPDDPHFDDPYPLDDETVRHRAPESTQVDDDRTRDHVPVGVRPRADPATAAGSPRRGGRRAAVGAAAAAGVALVAVGLAGAAIARGSGGDADATRPAADRAGCGAATPPAADVDGDGCRETLVVDGSTVDAGVARWTLGEPGDLVTVGDWDCDGDASAALLRPASGDVFLFATWADLDRPVTVTPVDRVAGGAAIRAEPAGGGDRPCDRLVVDTATGGTTTVAVPQ